MTIQSNTFAAACYNMSSIADLRDALENGPDLADMQEWNLTKSEWTEQIKLAIAELIADENSDAE